MPDLTLDELARILRDCAGEGESAGRDGEFADLPFTDLGYDSVAILETAARLKQEYGVVLTDDEVMEIGTPGRLLELARRQIAGAS
ncbi:acyl carrier protein [Streptomyces aurantiacus]|uniref:Actinorhodin polyketide synthase acyl carrier protein n=1 Tax=Streptomyces aurantiacus TaxID=47760 RepID=A0A7G1PAT6_9ACTN|nr:acyl carrier protein [Streptomyces aurantiacus]MDQ0779127.1 act minimal PKS acyl carrier protein [Streptomyces aurantiacus]BCL32518.1 actinorhodin polyketide synthase acyl carrier protein [Streptomyces aurantiacus]